MDPRTHPGDLSDDAYDEAVRALFARRPERMLPDLGRITTLAELLGRPDQAYPSIQITGTNGKTTTAHMVSCLLAALGLTPGTYTSPHLQDVRERIRVATQPLSRAQLVARLHELQPFLDEVEARHAQPASFFEVLTGVAFAHFADAPVDVGVFEVGMGGRWDATNLVRGEVAVLTEIGLDHAVLGATPAEVAGEKTGIVKDAAVVVSAPQEPQAAAVVQEATRRHQGRLVTAGNDFAVSGRRRAVGGQELDLRGVTGPVDEVFLPLYGEHQATNAACALAAVEGFLGFAGGIDPQVVREGFAAVRSPGRCEVVRRGPDQAAVILDGAHNPAGARALATTLSAEFGFRHRVVVLGVLGDKDVEGVVAELVGVCDHLVVTEPPSVRAAPADRVAKAARTRGTSVETAADVTEALSLADGVATAGDAVVVTGSLYTVGAARDALGLTPA